MESGDQRGSSHACTIPHQYRSQQEDTYLASPAGSDTTLLPPAGGRKISLPGNRSANERLSQLSQWKTTILQAPSFLQWTQQPLPTSPSSIKEFPLLCFTRLACGSPQLHVPNFISLLFPNKLVLLVK